MAKSTAVSTELPILREAGAQTKLFREKKSEFRIGYEGASKPEVLGILHAYDEQQVDATAAALIARFS